MSDKAKFHGEATMREEFGTIRATGSITNWGEDAMEAERISSHFGLKVVRRTVTKSQWVEVDA